MAASLGIMRFQIFSLSRRNWAAKTRKVGHRWCSSIASQNEESFEVQYPPIKPKYPPGEWGNMEPKVAWRLYDEGVELNKIPKVKDRLEKMAGPFDQPRSMYVPMALGAIPGSLIHKQYVTKTHVMPGLPDIYNTDPSVSKDKIDLALSRLKPVIEDILVVENEAHYKYKMENVDDFRSPPQKNPKFVDVEDRDKSARYRRNILLGEIVTAVQTFLSPGLEYLQNSQLDSNVRTEAFWKKEDVYQETVIKDKRKEQEEDTEIKDKRKYRFGKHPYSGIPLVWGAEDGHIITYQAQHRTSHQIRVEKPLPEFVAVDDPVCRGDYPRYPYAPHTAPSVFYIKDRPINISGHWLGDPCEFGLLSVQCLPDLYEQVIQDHGLEAAEKETLPYGLLASFATTAAQAHNQGFNFYWDITYPFTTQTIVTDGHKFRFIAYQLNTLHLHKDDKANPLRNLMWSTEFMPLYDVIEGGKVKGFNDDVFKMFLQTFFLAPRDRGVDLRPYVTEDSAPVEKNKHINFVGEEPIVEHKLGRYDAPRNAVYY